MKKHTVDIERFKIQLGKYGKKELETVLGNMKKNEERECALLVKEELDSRFSGWDKAKHKNSGAKATLATFNADARQFDSQREAYIWMLENHIRRDSRVLETLREKRPKTRQRFALVKNDLFLRSPHLLEQESHCHKLSNGWFVNMNLNGPQMFENLQWFGLLVSVGEPDFNWSWEVLG